jgi:hypothetical protein
LTDRRASGQFIVAGTAPVGLQDFLIGRIRIATVRVFE